MDEGLRDNEPGEDSADSEQGAERDPTLETEVEVTCPYCGEVVTIGLDSGGSTQEYVEDCQVCCRPWHVYVSYSGGGSVEVRVEATT